jgi:hypothetical protein
MSSEVRAFNGTVVWIRRMVSIIFFFFQKERSRLLMVQNQNSYTSNSNVYLQMFLLITLKLTHSAGPTSSFSASTIHVSNYAPQLNPITTTSHENKSTKQRKVAHVFSQPDNPKRSAAASNNQPSSPASSPSLVNFALAWHVRDEIMDGSRQPEWHYVLLLPAVLVPPWWTSYLRQRKKIKHGNEVQENKSHASLFFLVEPTQPNGWQNGVKRQKPLNNFLAGPKFAEKI